MSKSTGSRVWLREHFSDEYVRLAQERGYRSRATFKLAEIDQKDKLFRQGMSVIDLGASPGGWSQYVAGKVLPRGNIIALDLLPMEELDGVTFIQGDFTDDAIVNRLSDGLKGDLVDVVLSDMAPNMSGTRSVDQARSMYLAEIALDTALERLKPSGCFLVKLFQGEGIDDYQRQLRSVFAEVKVRKPKASRDRSRELYLLSKGLRSNATR